ncbi:ROK family protein [Staphylococcus sp. Marseille-Q5304]|uniref:ROK family protein n=1 Tax=Staphylococcus sp. Marseille-Q5304 TaxID=2942200 RepID=UPI0020748676|nr:ROK family protein [Staphylococcus sp. Marseille-Q5304]
MLKLCVDIGGTKTIVGVVNEHSEIIDQKRFQTFTSDPQQQFSEIIEIAHQFTQHYEQLDKSILNIAMPGPCDYRKGIFLNPPNLQAYNQFDAGQYIEMNSDFQPNFVNDTDAAIISEYQHIKDETDNFIYITISTGVGMAYVKDGRLVSGVDGNFGEVGHTIIKGNSDYLCPVCQQYGCVENEISGTAMSRKASDLLQRDVSTREAIDMYMKRENQAITEMIDEVLTLTQQLCTNLISIFNTYHIVLGGGVTQSKLPYSEKIIDYAKAHHLIKDVPLKVKVSDLEANVLTGLYYINE